VIKTIAEARRYAEGTAVRIEVKQVKDVAAVEALAVIKLEHEPAVVWGAQSGPGTPATDEWTEPSRRRN
jgi:hypothetical protein